MPDRLGRVCCGCCDAMFSAAAVQTAGNKTPLQPRAPGAAQTFPKTNSNPVKTSKAPTLYDYSGVSDCDKGRTSCTIKNFSFCFYLLESLLRWRVLLNHDCVFVSVPATRSDRPDSASDPGRRRAESTHNAHA